MKRKKSQYKHAVIANKRYYFYSIRWVDICGDSSHATKEEFDKMEPAYINTHAYVFKRDNKYLYTFASFDENEAVFSDRNIIPKGCVLSMKKVLI
jgi:hypothetical protein|tara:strand:+ start:232 stop:516 length:285 start_codon:yes stop_codon:yes gene_type:complete